METTAGKLGATPSGHGRTDFLVWAPNAQSVELYLTGSQERLLPMEASPRGYHHLTTEELNPGTLYKYRLDRRLNRADPASRFQPQGVHGPSQIIRSDFDWEDQHWYGLPLRDYIIYELHVGTFTREGTFDAVVRRIEDIKKLGLTAIELMPVAQFPGDRNWGYDGVYPFAVQNSYGGPEGLKRLVNACHLRGIAVVLDVVYNHLGPEGNYLGDFGPYFTERYKTPWGRALNFDGPDSDEVRRFFIENALYWVTEFHIDALRVDAVHAILDHSPNPFLEELAAEIHEAADYLNRRVYVIAESAANDSRLIRSRELGGYGLDAQWNDDFHHSLRVLLTGDQNGYFQDYGRLRHLEKAFRDGFVYSGEYSAFRRRRHGISSRDIPAGRFVVFAQNHDQVGNHARGERLCQLAGFDRLKLAAGAVILSPFIPLIFMGEEYGETAPFRYFTSHSDPVLVEAVRKGRQEEFAAFSWQGQIPDPQDENTFLRSKLNQDLNRTGHHRVLLDFYEELIRLRKQSPALECLSKQNLEVIGYEEEKVLWIRRWRHSHGADMLFNFTDRCVKAAVPVASGLWVKSIDSSEERWLGSGSELPSQFDGAEKSTLSIGPWAFAVFIHETGEGSET